MLQQNDKRKSGVSKRKDSLILFSPIGTARGRHGGLNLRVLYSEGRRGRLLLLPALEDCGTPAAARGGVSVRCVGTSSPLLAEIQREGSALARLQDCRRQRGLHCAHYVRTSLCGWLLAIVDAPPPCLAEIV